MAFQGDGAQIPIANIIQALLLNGQEGVLTVVSGDLRCRLRVLPYGIRPLAYEPADPAILRRVLVKEGILSEAEFRNAMSGWDPRKGFAGDFLVKRRLLTPEQVENEVRKQFEELLYELLSAKDLHYEFEAGVDLVDHEIFDPEGLGEALLYNVHGLLMEAARREDEARRIRAEIPGDGEIFVPADKRLPESPPEGLELPPERYRILRAQLLKERSLKRIAEESSLSLYEVLQGVYFLKKEGFVRPLPLEEKKKLAERLRRLNKVREAIDVYRSILAVVPEDTTSRSELVALLEKAKHPAAELVSEYMALAERLEADDPERALAYAVKALQSDPQNIAAHRKLFELRCVKEDRSGALAAARNLARVARESNRYVEAASFLEEAKKRFPDETFFQHEAADLFLEAGERERALRNLKEAAKRHKDRGDLQRLLKTYERIAQIDPAERSKLKKIEQICRRTKTSPWKRVRLAAAAGAAAVLVFASAYVAYNEIVARRVLAEVDREVERHLEAGSIAKARECIEDFTRRFPRLLSQKRLAAIADRVLDREMRQREAEQARYEAITRKIVSTIAVAEDLLKKRRPLEARDRLASVYQELSGEDLTPSHSEKLRRLKALLDRVSKYLKEAEDLAARIRDEAAEATPESVSEAHRLSRLLLDRYPDSPPARGLRFPVLVVTSPAGAVVRHHGRDLGRTPIVLWLTPQGDVSMEAELEGHHPVDFSVDPLLRAVVRLALPKKDVWRFDTGGPIEGSPAAEDHFVYAANRNGAVYCLSRDGTVRWKFTVPERADVSGGVRLWGDALYFGSFDGRLYILDKRSGRLLHRVRLGPSTPPLEIRAAPSVPTASGRALVNRDGKEVAAVDLVSGKVAWRLPAPARDRGREEFLGTPRLDRGRALIATRGGQVYVVALADGNVLRRIDFRGELAFAPAPLGESLIGILSRGEVVLLDLRTGSPLWKRADLPAVATAPPCAAEKAGAICLAAADGSLVALSALTGETRWRLEVSSRVEAPLTVAGDEYIAGTTEGQLLAVKIDSGVLDWKFRTAGADSTPPKGILCSPVFAGGRLYVGADDGYLYALEIEARERTDG